MNPTGQGWLALSMETMYLKQFLSKALIAVGVTILLGVALSHFANSYTGAVLNAIDVQEQTQDDFINESRPKIVRLNDVLLQKGGGTGFFVRTPRGNKFILTNNHVCGLADSGKILVDGTYYATVLANSEDHDLCLISNPLEADGIEVAPNSRTGENIYLLGHPLLEPTSLVKGQLSGRLLVDIMIGVNIPCTGKNMKNIETEEGSIARIFGVQSVCLREYMAEAVTANILPGNSGSPILNHAGQVVGVAFAGREGSGRGYIVPLEYIRKFLENK